MNPIRALPIDEWWGLRVAGLVGGSLLVVLAVSGVFEATLFHQPTTIKYLVTIGVAVVPVLLAAADSPLRLMVGILIVGGPFSFIASVSGFQISPLLGVAAVAMVLALPREGGGVAALRPMGVAFALLLLPGIAGSDNAGPWLMWLALTVASGWLTFLVAREPGGPMFVCAMLALSAVIQGGLAIWEFKTGHRLNVNSASGGSAISGGYFFNYNGVSRSSAGLQDPIGLGQVLALWLPITIALAAALRQQALSIAAVCAGGVAALGLLLTLSRMSIIGGLVGVVVALLLLPGGSRIRTSLSVLAVGVVVVLLGLGIGGKHLRTRINSIFNPTAAHVSTRSGDIARQHIWRAAVKTGEANPITGVGFGRITTYLPRYGAPVTGTAHAHDTYLQFFAEGGLPGLIALLGVVAASFRDLLRAFRSHRVWVAGAAGGLTATLIAWSTDVEVRYVQVSAMVAVVIGLIAALSATAGGYGETKAPVS